MVGACIDHDDEIAASEVGVAGFRKQQAGIFCEVTVSIGKSMASAFERPDAYRRLRGGRGYLRVFLEQSACKHGDVMRGAVAS